VAGSSTLDDMTGFFRSLDIDQISFWIGFLTGILFFWLAIRARPALKEISRYLKARALQLREGLTTSTEARLRADILKLVQRQHLAAALCALDEIVITPKVFLPRYAKDEDDEVLDLETIEDLIPFLPDYPEIGTAFHAPTFTLSEALQLGANVLVFGPPGSGKSTALNHLATLFARKETDLGDIAEYLPIFIDAKEILQINPEQKTSFASLFELTSRYASTITQTRLGEVLRLALSRGRVVLIVDSIDELPPNEVDQISDWLATVLKEYPETRIVAAASTYDHNSLVSLGLHPVGMAGWSKFEKEQFLDKWSVIWNEIVFSQPLNPYATTSPIILRSWLRHESYAETPMDFTLRVWSAYAGDSLGPGIQKGIEAYLRRLVQETPKAHSLLISLAASVIYEMKPYFRRSSLQKLISDTLPPAEQDMSTELEVQENSGDKVPPPSPSTQIINSLIQQGVLREVGGDSLAFGHVWLTAYLASKQYAEVNYLNRLFAQPLWEGRQVTLGLISGQQDLSDYILPQIDQQDEPLEKSLIEAAAWLKYADQSFSWPTHILKSLAMKVQDGLVPAALRLRLMAALVDARDSSTEVLFRRMLSHHQPATRVLGCFGCGISNNPKLINDLALMIQDPDPGVKKAATISLAAIGGHQAIETIALAMLHGDEILQKCAAEMLATDAEEGYETLVEASSFDDFVIRRAAVYGLKKSGEKWAFEILQKLQMEDSQWVVRNAAEQAVQQLSQPYPFIPIPYARLMNTPWLIEYAGKQGSGISSDQGAEDMLYHAAQNGTELEKLLAFERILFLPEIQPGGITPLYHAIYGENSELKEAAFTILWMISCRNIPLPEPTQFGF
jgi:energy-coupling factor transporter ATP-binding protein EcfA2